MDIRTRRRGCGKDLHEAAGEPSPQALHLLVRHVPSVELPEVAQECSHAEGEEDKMLNMQPRASLTDVGHDMLHSFQVQLLLQHALTTLTHSILTHLVLLPTEVMEICRPHRFAYI
eukprot:CAMPEP_0115678884 /NCGR_PEP_ID=MMETSP0272-20121206/55996_1 /TAXON_ID=71861 /ORGANISM="Scrippsiella trochoidea, Strain CCMP3099" /LENGTH=115 /DNA_ID=CAMNT_0003118097 /DNA_START=386 /DNA_END=733 /DNA_ORIENTATION=-